MNPPKNRRTVHATDGLALSVVERGPAAAPVVVAVHGYPDNQAVWGPIAEHLADTFRVVTYDVRGSGDSGTPADRSGYRIPQLNADLAAVVDAVSPDRPVHLLAHDWGSIQCWDAVGGTVPPGRIASYTSISGPSLDHAAVWLRGAASHGLLGARHRLLQALESYYVMLFQAPLLPELMWRSGVLSQFLPSALTQDGVNGVELYRANVPKRLLRPDPPRVSVPTQVVVPTGDRYVSAPLAAEAPVPYVDALTVTEVDGGHWVIREQPGLIAGLVRDFAGRHPAAAS